VPTKVRADVRALPANQELQALSLGLLSDHRGQVIEDILEVEIGLFDTSLPASIFEKSRMCDDAKPRTRQRS